MADTVAFFTDFLPKKIAAKPEMQAGIKNSITFDIAGAGVWTLDLTEAPGAVKEGAVEKPGCTIKVAKADWEAMLDKPSEGMKMFMTGKLKVSGSTGLAMQLQKILS